ADAVAQPTPAGPPGTTQLHQPAGFPYTTLFRSGSFPAETLFASTLQGSSNGYSTNSSDYNGIVNQQVSFAAGQTSAQVTISVIKDSSAHAGATVGFIDRLPSCAPVTTVLAQTEC